MERHNNVEVILHPKSSLTYSEQKELVRWLKTAGQFPIAVQYVKTRKLVFRVLKEAPPIYLS